MLLAGVMFSLCTTTGTLSKMATTGTATVAVARAGIFRVCLAKGTGWVEIASGALGEKVNIDLFKILYEDDAATLENLSNSHVTVAGSTETAIIAPGTGGEMMIEIKNFSEVSVNVNVATSTVTSNGIPVLWETSPGSNAWASGFPGVTANATLTPLGGNQTYKFKWHWVFEEAPITNGISASDAGDTSLGVTSAGRTAANELKYSIDLTVSAAQID